LGKKFTIYGKKLKGIWWTFKDEKGVKMKTKLPVIAALIIAVLSMALTVSAKTEQKPNTAEKAVNTVFEPEIVLPDKIPAVVGREVNIYFENIMNDNPDKYQIDVVCSIGSQQNERWTCIPEAEGTYPLTVKVFKDYSLAAQAYTEVIVQSEDDCDSADIKCLFIGDSITSGGVYTSELLRLAEETGMNLSLIGTKGTAPNLHEGISGKTADYFFTDPQSPFVFNQTFNFSRYMKKNNYDTVNYVFISLGINDLIYINDDKALEERIASMLYDYRCMVNSIKSFDERIKIGLVVTIPPSRSQDAFGRAYGCGQTRWRYKRNNFIWVKSLINEFKGDKEQGVYLVPANVNLDTEHNMLTETVPVNARNSLTVTRQRDGVHPAASGYMQIADMIYYFLRGLNN
jgi:lysophospholipase L1-like esterase